MKKLIWLSIPLLFSGILQAQTDLDLTFGASKSDYNVTTLRLTRSLNPNLRVGLSYEFSDYRYRFIDARPVSGGFAGTLRLLLVGKLAETGRMRLDGFLKPGYRFIPIDETSEQEFNYEFQSSHTITLDPGLIVSLKASEKWIVHTGVNAHMAFQVQPEPLFEQFPSARIILGSSYRLKDKWTAFITTQAGPMSGGSGDTEKFFWMASIGLRYHLGGRDASSGLIGY